MPEYVHPDIQAAADSPTGESALEVAIVPVEESAEAVRSELEHYSIGEIDQTPSGILVTYIAESDMASVTEIAGIRSISRNTSQGALTQGN